MDWMKDQDFVVMMERTGRKLTGPKKTNESLDPKVLRSQRLHQLKYPKLGSEIGQL